MEQGVAHQGSSLCTLVEDPQSKLHYVVSIAITDLDFKQAYKIQRSLHNDRRMIRAFWNALRTEPSFFLTTDLVHPNYELNNQLKFDTVTV